MIRLFARHRTAANMLMALMLVAGLLAVGRLETGFLPDAEIDRIVITVAWPGAGAEDIDNAIVQRIEPEVRFVDGVNNVRSKSRDGTTTIILEFVPGTDMQAALSNVEAALTQVTALPLSSERPQVGRPVRYEDVIRLAVSGPYSERALKSFAKQIRDDLLERGIDKIGLNGARDEEILVEVSPETLLRLDLTLSEIAGRIDETLVDMPLGVAGGGVERRLRSSGLVKEAGALSGIEIKALPDGRRIYMDDVAEVAESFDPDEIEYRRGGARAIDLIVKRPIGGDAIGLASIVNSYLAGSALRFPPNLKIETHFAVVEQIESRVNLMIRIAVSGLILVLVILFLFLNGAVAFWVAVGIPVSVMTALAIMAVTGQSLNMITLLSIIMIIGIVVDDAIIVGEHVEHRYRQGMAPLEAAVTGAERMLVPVTGASLTTIAAFAPLLMVGDAIGQIVSAIPVVVIAAVTASLVECFLVLPGHLHHSLVRHREALPALRRAIDKRFSHFRDVHFRRWAEAALRWRYTTVSMAIGSLLVVIGLVAGGRIVFTFFPSPESDVIFANVELSVGTPKASTVAMVDELELALQRAEDALTDGQGNIIKTSIGSIGRSTGIDDARIGDNFGGITVELQPSDTREVRTADFIEAWRDQIRPVAGLSSLSIMPLHVGPPGRAIHIDLIGEDALALKATAEELKQFLGRYPTISDLEDNLPYGNPEVILELTAKGLGMGFSTESVGRQIRDSYEGAIATRFARDGEEITVRVQLGEGDADAGSLNTLYLRSPNGGEVPLSEIVSLRERSGFASIARENGARIVSVTGEFASDHASLADTLADAEANGLAEIAARHDVTYSLAGKAKEQDAALSDLALGAITALALIYLVLASTFASYSRPLVVMSIIPFGVVGAVLGHMLLGFNLTVLSVVAMIGLSGIVVNDSIILISTIDERMARGEDRFQAIIDGSCDRLRAVMLTSVTTIAGLTPLLFETSLQARFLMPMAITLVFGLMATTVLVLFVVPSLVGIQADFGDWARRHLDREAAHAKD